MMEHASSQSAAVLFWLLFPGFFFYQLLVGSGVIPPFAGGGFGVAAAAAALLLVCCLPLWLPRVVVTDRLVVLLWSGFFLSAMLITAYGSLTLPAEYRMPAVLQSSQALIYFAGMFFVGFFLVPDSPGVRSSMLFAALGMLLFLGWYTLSTGSVMFYARFFFGHAEELATYQGFARSALMVFLLLLTTARRPAQTWLWTVLGTYVLFVLGARSEFFAYVAVSMLILAHVCIRRPLLVIYLMLTLLALTIAGSALVSVLGDSRQLEVLDLSSSTSWQARQELLHQSLALLAEKPWMGEFGGHIRLGGTAGSYVHNALSGWISYGLFGFLCYVLTIGVATAVSLLRMLDSPALNGRWSFVFAVNFVSLLLISVAKPVFWPIPALGIGLYLSAWYAERLPEPSQAASHAR